MERMFNADSSFADFFFSCAEAEHKDPATKSTAVTQAVRVLAKNLDNHPDCWNTHLWIALILSDKDEDCSLEARVEEAILIKQHIDVS